MLLKFGAVLSIICGFLMVIYTWIHLLQCIVVVWSLLRMLKLRKLAVRKLYLSRGGRTRCQGVSDHGLNLHRNIPLNRLLQCNLNSHVQKEISTILCDNMTCKGMTFSSFYIFLMLMRQKARSSLRFFKGKSQVKSKVSECAT